MTTFYDNLKNKKFRTNKTLPLNNNLSPHKIKISQLDNQTKYGKTAGKNFRTDRMFKTINLVGKNKKETIDNPRDEVYDNKQINVDKTIAQRGNNLKDNHINFTQSTSPVKSTKNIFKARASIVINLNKDLANEDNLKSLNYIKVAYKLFMN